MDKWQIMQNQVAENLTTISPLKRQSFAQLCLKRALMANIIAGVLQYLGLMLATLLLPPSLLWFSAGVAVGMVFLRGYKILPGIYLGSFAAYLWAGSGYIMAFWAASLHTLQPLVLVWLSRQTQCLSLIFYETRSFLKFVILSALVTAVISFLLAYSAIQGLSLQLWLLWRYWWLADFNGLIIFAIALVTWDGYLPELSFDLKKNLLPVCDFLFLCTMLIFLVLSTHLWMAALSAAIIAAIFYWRIRLYGWPGIVLGCFLLGLLLSLASMINAPLFVQYHARPLLQLAIALFSIIIFLTNMNKCSNKLGSRKC